MKTKFPPGHAEAIKAGCKCPANNGAGDYVDAAGNHVYWFDFRCPLHGDAEQVPLETILFAITADKK